MCESLVQDLEMNRRIRRVLVEHGVDLGRVYMCTCNGRPKVKGSLVRLPWAGFAGGEKPADRLVEDIRNLTDSGEVDVELTE